MLNVLVSLLFSGFFTLSAFASSQNINPLLGEWLFARFVFKGSEYQAPNPNLKMTFELRTDHISRLYYKRSDESGFCERLAKYSYDEKSQLLFQEIYWVNPENQISCTSDPDMQQNRKTINKAFIVNESLNLEMPLSDDNITFIWDRI